MLFSFWDYLRRRTSESILLGMKDALNISEQGKAEAEPAAPSEFLIHLDLTAAARAPAPDSRRNVANGDSTATKDAMPRIEETVISPEEMTYGAPRRRGRPRKHRDTP